MLATDTGEYLRPDRVSAYLTGKVDLKTGIDTYHFRIPGNNKRIVGPGHVFEYYVGILIHIVI